MIRHNLIKTDNLPISKDLFHASTKPDNQKKTKRIKAIKNKILIFERRENTQEILINIFKNFGYEVYSISEINQIQEIKYDLLITEIENSNEVIKKVSLLNPDIKIIIFSNFSRDKFIEDIYFNKGIESLIEKSYKVKDLIKMAAIALSTNPYNIFSLETYMDEEDDEFLIKSMNFKIKKEKLETVNIGMTISEEVEKLLIENNIKNKIDDIDMLQYAIGELIDNSIEAQLCAKKKNIELNLKYGFDSNKFGFSIQDNLGTLPHTSVVNGICMKIYDEKGGTPPEYYLSNTYFGPRGRGYYIIQYSVHRLSVLILRPETAKKYNVLPLTEASLLVYFNKKRNEIDNQIGPCGLSLVVSI